MISHLKRGARGTREGFSFPSRGNPLGSLGFFSPAAPPSHYLYYNTMKTYEVEFKSTTYRHYIVKAPNKKFAEEYATEELQGDEEVSNAWTENAEVSAITAGVDECGNKLEDEQ